MVTKVLERFLTNGPRPANALAVKLNEIGGSAMVTRLIDAYHPEMLTQVPETWWEEPHVVTWLVEVSS